MSEDEDNKEIKIDNKNEGINEDKEKKENEEKVKLLDDDVMNKSNEILINEFNEYFRNNNINKDNLLFNSFNINNNKEFNINDANQLPFILDKDQFYQSFVLFQKYIYWNMQKKYNQKINQEQLNTNNNIVNANTMGVPRLNTPIKNKNNEFNLKNKNSDDKIESNKNNINNENIVLEKKEERHNNTINKLKDINDENRIVNQKSQFNNVFYESKYSSTSKNKKFENYDEKPIKTHKNFMELFELSIRNKNLEIFEKIYKGKIKLLNKKNIKRTNSFHTIDYNIINNENINFVIKKNSFDNIIQKNIVYKNLIEKNINNKNIIKSNKQNKDDKDNKDNNLINNEIEKDNEKEKNNSGQKGNTNEELKIKEKKENKEKKELYLEKTQNNEKDNEKNNNVQK